MDGDDRSVRAASDSGLPAIPRTTAVLGPGALTATRRETGQASSAWARLTTIPLDNRLRAGRTVNASPIALRLGASRCVVRCGAVGV